MPWWGYLLIGLFVLVIAPFACIQYTVAHSLFYKYLVRNKKESWDREPKTDDPETQKIYEKGRKEFYDTSKEYLKEVSITSEGFKLVGEFYDFGAKKTALVVAGRSEALTYSYYFAIPYKKLGFNILVIDNRSHGLSEGNLNSIGLKEWKDIVNWCHFLHDELHQEEIVGHGVCIGAATMVYALTNANSIPYFKGLVADGMYQNFPISFVNHAKEAGYPKHFVFDIFFLMFKIKMKEDPFYGPINCIDKINIPIQFIYSKVDRYSTPDKAQELYDKCQSLKEIAWFDKGRHSFVRLNNEDGYDQVIDDFLNKYNL